MARVTDFNIDYLVHEIKYVDKLLKYMTRDTINPNGTINEYAVLQEIVKKYDFKMIMYMKFAYPYINLRYNTDIIFMTAYTVNDIEFVKWLFSIYPDMLTDPLITELFRIMHIVITKG